MKILGLLTLCLRQPLWLFLILAVIFGDSNLSYGQTLVQENFKTHLRWSVVAPKDLLLIEGRPEKLVLRSLDFIFLEKLAEQVRKLDLHKKYFKTANFSKEVIEGKKPEIDIDLASAQVEIFNFYKDADNKYIIDFWIDEGTPSKVETPVLSNDSSPASKEIILPVKVAVKTKPVILSPQTPVAVQPTPAPQLPLIEEKTYRDFRYGAAFFWDYGPLAPKFDYGINLERKGPEHFYPIQDRLFEKDEKEAHMQLTINLYRKNKYGLMFKSITLYEQKYGEDSNQLLNEFLKANAIIKEGIRKGDLAPVRMALQTLDALAEKTKDYNLAKGILKYQMAYHMEKKDYVQALNKAKKLYVKSKENFDYEESSVASEGILHCLAQLSQIDQLEDFLGEKTVEKLLAGQIRLAYLIYTELRLGHTEAVTRAFEKQKASLVKPIHPTILLNVAEAYFRQAKYEEAIPLYDMFISDYSQYTEAARARVRLGLIYEITDREPKLTLALYKNAIDRSQDLMIRYEAQIRYAALRNLRKIQISSADKEARVFLESPLSANSMIDANTKKLLWLVRLRTLIVDLEYKKGLSYLTAIPLAGMGARDAKVFEEDGAEIIVGILFDAYKKADYPTVIKTWELYKDKYIRKVAFDPETNFIAAQSYLMMGLTDGTQGIYEDLTHMKESPEKSYPYWVERSSTKTVNEYLLELKISMLMKKKDWKQLAEEIEKLAQTAGQNNKKVLMYRGLEAHARKDYVSAIKWLERFFLEKNPGDIRGATEAADLMKMYTDAIYESGDLTKFKSVAKALLNDTKAFAASDFYVESVKQRIHYLLIESIASQRNSANSGEIDKQLLAEIGQFQANFKKSSYKGRLDYLMALSLLGGNRVDEGRAILNGLLQDESVSEYIKEMARSELSLLKIKEKTI
ncbi:MAG: hypothetical protein HYV97_17165 [Bdellovibrio sp.]|nr:hypothetical protein [Bdellovibrio sp.]